MGLRLTLLEYRRKAGAIAGVIEVSDGTRVLHTDGCLLTEAKDRAAFYSRLGARLNGSCPPQDVVEERLQDLLTEAHERLAEEAESAAPAGRPPSQATRLVQMVVVAGMDLWHSPDGLGFGSYVVGDHRETRPLRSQGFRRHLAQLFYAETQSSPGAQALQDAITVLDGQANHDGAEASVFTRVAETGGALYLELGDRQWLCVEVTQQGWRVRVDPPVKFWRPAHAAALPEPRRGGDLAELRRFLNVGSEADFVLLVS